MSERRLLRLEVNEENLPVMGRNAQGPVLLRLLPGEEVIGAAAIDADRAVWLATRQGSIKQLGATEIRQCHRGDIGQICIRFGQRDDHVVDLQSSNVGVLGALLSDGRSVRINSAELAETQQLGLGGKETLAELVPLQS